MTDTLDGTDTEAETGEAAPGERARGSVRGKFTVWQAPELPTPPTAEAMATADLSTMPTYYEHGKLLEEHDEAEVHDAIIEMVRAISPGLTVTPLFAQEGPKGMSLVHAWFAPDFPLFRHSHPGLGDCLYYVAAGSIVLGSQTLRAGDGFFVPNGMPYKYKAGPDGVEVLEFRGRIGIEGAPAMVLDEPSVESIRQIIDTCNERNADWPGAAPRRVNDLGRREEYDPDASRPEAPEAGSVTPRSDGSESDMAVRWEGSAGGKFEVYRAPVFARPPSPADLANVDASKVADGFAHEALAAREGESETRDAINELIRATAPGNLTNILLWQGGDQGMSAVHVWFGPNLSLFRHSHPGTGDCLYYVQAGSVILGNKVLEAGDGFFVPNGMPYKYKAGPEGVEVIEFRADTGIEGAPAIQFDEPTVASVQRITDHAKELNEAWPDAAPRVVNDLARRKTIDA